MHVNLFSPWQIHLMSTCEYICVCLMLWPSEESLKVPFGLQWVISDSELQFRLLLDSNAKRSFNAWGNKSTAFQYLGASSIIEDSLRILFSLKTRLGSRWKNNQRMPNQPIPTHNLSESQQASRMRSTSCLQFALLDRIWANASISSWMDDLDLGRGIIDELCKSSRFLEPKKRVSASNPEDGKHYHETSD